MADDLNYETKVYKCDPTDEGVVVDVLAEELARDGWVLHATQRSNGGFIKAEFRRPLRPG